MIAIGIVAFAVVGILAAFPVGVESARDARDENTAALIADDIFTRLRSQPWQGGNTLTVPKGGGLWSAKLTSAGQPGWSYSPPAGTIANDQLFYYTVDGMPSNFASSGIGSWGTQPSPNSPYKGDEGYFGVRVYLRAAPYYGCSSDTTVGQNNTFGAADPRGNMMSLATVIVEVSWPARQPYNNRHGAGGNSGHCRQFYSAIVNLH